MSEQEPIKKVRTLDSEHPQAENTWDCELSLPQLFLVCRSGPPAVDHGKWLRDWYLLSHQTSGIACRHVEFYATPLQPNGRTAMGLAQISEALYGSNLAAFDLSLSEATDYQERLQALGLSCETSFQDLQEGYYPIDLPAHLGDFVEDHLPEDLDDLLDWQGQHELAKMIGILKRWSLAWVSNNSD